VVIEGKEKVIYVELLKALYGTLRAARLFWEKLTGKLVDWGFTPNKYDGCVYNKMVNGKQITVVFHVDNVKLSCVDSTTVDWLIEQLDHEFGKETPLSKSRGKVHDYLGMIFDFTEAGVVSITMFDYIKSVLEEVPKDMLGEAATPAANYLFDVSENPTKLEAERADQFHRMVMQLMYLSQRARPDLRTAVSFLCKRTSSPDTDDWKKLARTMKYLQITQDLPWRLSSDGTGRVRWWIDAAYGVHADMKGHTGGTMSMGKGSIYSTSGAQKIVTRSSTECEVVGVDDVLPQVIWTGYFLEEQGYPPTDTIVYQDNVSAMQLEKNGRASSGKRTRHINIRYFFIKDKVDSGEVKLEWCPTKQMLADFFTKPLQGMLFYRLRDYIMNIDPSSPYHSSHRSVLGNHDLTDHEYDAKDP
jgi:hypothetical protein